MSERVFYHHKKASAGAMLARLVELVGEENKPKGDEGIYPAPWTDGSPAPPRRHMVHFSDSDLIDYLGNVKERMDPADLELQRKLYIGLRYRREEMYRTLLVVDTDLVHQSKHSADYFAEDLRGPKEKPTNRGRKLLEGELTAAAGAKEGDVIVYCPSLSMQSKLVDARLEINVDRILPLRVQREFTYQADLDVLQGYYDDLWRAYLFVAPRLFEDPTKCKAVVDAFCKHYDIIPATAYRKVRHHDLDLGEGVVTSVAFQKVENFLAKLELKEIPPSLLGDLLGLVGSDSTFLSSVRANGDVRQRLTMFLHIAVLSRVLQENAVTKRLKKPQAKVVEDYCASLRMGGSLAQPSAREKLVSENIEDFTERLLEAVLSAVS
jgi:hypothetical protein